MKYLNDKELANVEGGAFKIGIFVGVAAGITFLIGLVDGIMRPLKCN